MTLLGMCIALALPTQDTGPLIESLLSDDIEARTEAEQRLIERGALILPELEKRRGAATDQEVRARLGRVIAEIQKRERTLTFRPKPIRVSLDLKAVTLAEALGQVFDPLDLSCSVKAAKVADRKFSLRLKDATLWQALDAICKESRTEVRGHYRPWSFYGTPLSSLGWERYSDTGEVRIHAMPGVSSTRGDKGLSISLRALVPPAHLPISGDLRGLTLKDDQGVKIPFRHARAGRIGLRKEPGGVVAVEMRGLYVAQSDLKSTKHVDVQGECDLLYPEKVRLVSLDLETAHADLTITKDAKIEVRGVEYVGNEIRLSLLGKPATAGPPITVVMWLENSDGKRVVLVNSPTHLGDLRVYFSTVFEPKFRPVRLVVARVDDTLAITVPFKISRLHVPASLRK